MQIVIFTLNDKLYAIDTNNVDEICKRVPSTRVPNSPHWVEGLINLRGNLVTLVNLCKLLHLEDNLCYNNTIIIENNGEKIGILVKDVIEVIDIDLKDIQKLKDDSIDEISGLLLLNENIVNIIDVNKLLCKNEG